MTTSSAPDRQPEVPVDQEEMRRRLVAAVRRVCPPAVAADADDLVQRAMLKLNRISASSEGNAAFSASYLWRVAYTAVIDEIRRRDRRREVPLTDDSAASMPVSPQPDPEREAASRAIGEAIRDCLARMVESRRRAVTLRLVGHTVPEIARLLDWRPKRADNSVYRGMTDLRRCLTSKGISP